jgi:hypothetical protein
VFLYGLIIGNRELRVNMDEKRMSKAGVKQEKLGLKIVNLTLKCCPLRLGFKITLSGGKTKQNLPLPIS